MSIEKFKAVVLDEPGTALDGFSALQLRDIEVQEPGAGEVLVRTALAPINPSDLLFVADKFPGPTRPSFPGQVAGISGAGYLASADGAESEPKKLFHYTAFGTWAEYITVPAESLIELPSDYPLELAAQFSNVVTAWQLVENSGVQPGQWLALTAGYSTVATIAAQFAARKGIKVVSIVRKKRPEVDLSALGAAAVIAIEDSSSGLRERVLDATAGEGLSGVIDCVTGHQLGELIRACAPFARVQLYGVLDESPLGLSGAEIMYTFVRIEPYSYPFSFVPPQSESDFRMLQEVIESSTGGAIKSGSAGIFKLADFRSALEEYLEGGRPGKIFLSVD
ncbi:zinc-binding dehydrogenase [Nocardia sp. R6R-6]|uniref:zinc-binding dehydrogenase n=1 Tax=Nocardia sp. R6R-6 TaxID=3459303 RepID=UPI00403D81CB